MFTKIASDGAPMPATAGPSPGLLPADFLMGRIACQGHYSAYTESRVDFPYATGAVSSPHSGQTNSVADLPLSQIVIYPDVTSYQTGGPLITSDGAPVPSTGPGAWGQLRAAGRVR